MRPFFADSVSITTSRGERFTTADAYFDDMKKRDYNNFSWELLSIYSVDIKPNVGGEHVQAYFKNIWKDSRACATIFSLSTEDDKQASSRLSLIGDFSKIKETNKNREDEFHGIIHRHRELSRTQN